MGREVGPHRVQERASSSFHIPTSFGPLFRGPRSIKRNSATPGAARRSSSCVVGNRLFQARPMFYWDPRFPTRFLFDLRFTWLMNPEFQPGSAFCFHRYIFWFCFSKTHAFQPCSAFETPISALGSCSWAKELRFVSGGASRATRGAAHLREALRLGDPHEGSLA